MRQRSPVVAAAFMSLGFGLSISAAAQTALKDHPLISRFPGSTIHASSSVKQFDEITFPAGAFRKGKFEKSQRLEGKVTRLLYENPKDHSVLEIFRSYQQALSKGAFETLFACSAAECADAGTVMNDPIPDFGYWCVGNSIQCPEPMRYLAARLRRNSGDVYVALKVRTEETYLNIVEVKPMQEGLVTVKSAETLNTDIGSTGHSAVYGVYFDTGKAVVKLQSDPTLAEIVKLLKADPAMKLHVVGHTDNAGTYAFNMTLSKQRADAVVAALVSKYRIPAARLDAAGVGSLSPVSTNHTEEGRAKNRRVELVEQ